MIYALFRRIFLTLINFLLLSLICFSIFLRDPDNVSYSKPHFLSGYWTYINHLLQSDVERIGVITTIKNTILSLFPATLELCFSAMLLALLIGFPLGVIGAFQRDNLYGKSISALSSLGVSVPVFWIAPILMYLASISRWEISSIGQYNSIYDIQPFTGFAMIDVWFINSPDRGEIIKNVLQHLALPTLVLAIAPTMEMTRLIIQRTEWVLQQNFVKFAMTKGGSNFTILRRYVLRHCIPLLIIQFPRMMPFVLALSMLIENTFSWPGIGRWLILAVEQQNYNHIATGVLAIGLFMICVNILAECAVFLLDPFGKKGWANNVR